MKQSPALLTDVLGKPAETLAIALLLDNRAHKDLKRSDIVLKLDLSLACGGLERVLAMANT